MSATLQQELDSVVQGVKNLEAENERLRRFAKDAICPAHFKLPATTRCEFGDPRCNNARAALEEPK